jgi:hypothetical protein
VPVLVIEVPPLGDVDGETFGLHGGAKEFAIGALLLGASGVIWMGANGEIIVAAGHVERLSGFQIEYSEVDGAAAIVARPLRGIGDVFVIFGRRGIPENFRDVPGTIAIENQQSKSLRVKFFIYASHCFSGGALEKCARLGVHRSVEKIIRGRVVNVELDCGIKFDQLD